jgi:nucleoside-diphosphate-sugar epimerase
VGPTFVYGPFVPNFHHMIPEPEPTHTSFSTNFRIYAFLNPRATEWIPGPAFVDVRDVAKAHILALTSKSSSELGPDGAKKKRFILVAPDSASIRSGLTILKEKRGSVVEGRLADIDTVQDVPPLVEGLKYYREELGETVGFKEEMYKKWEETVVDAVDSILEIENIWMEKGFNIGDKAGADILLPGEKRGVVNL